MHDQIAVHAMADEGEGGELCVRVDFGRERVPAIDASCGPPSQRTEAREGFEGELEDAEATSLHDDRSCYSHAASSIPRVQRPDIVAALLKSQ